MWPYIIITFTSSLAVVALRPSAETTTIQSPPAEIVLTSGDRPEMNGLVVKRTDDNLTLSCTLVDSNNTTLTIDGVHIEWFFPRQNSNRSRMIRNEGNVSRLTIESLQSSDAGQYSCFIPDMDGFVAHALVAVKPLLTPVFGSTPFCGGMMFSCGDENTGKSGVRCVPYSVLCDGRSDCPYPARDESVETCGTTNPCLDKLLCADGRCIPKTWCCNGRKNCIPHPCCVEPMHDEYPASKTGGELRRNPNDQSNALQSTLYKACAFFLLFLIAISLFISAICRVRLKRIANGQVLDFNMGISTPEVSERQTSPASPVPRDCQYSLVRYSDPDTNYDVLNQMSAFPPSYSEYLASTNRRFDLTPHNNNISSSPTSRCTSRTVAEESRNGNVSEPDRDDSGSVHNSPARRPNDFGMGVIANAIFNSRYRPVPQQNVEITSIDYPTTDSDSSCRSPGARIPNNPLNSGTVEFNSHFYGERIGGSPDINILRGLPDNRRLTHINALDRILDRFGLNAPYNVDIARQTENSSWECQSFLSPTDSNQTPDRRRVFSTMWSRFKDRLRGHHSERGHHNAMGNNRTPGGNAVSTGRRRRPDTPDVAEITLDDHQQHTLTCFIGDRMDPSCGELNYQRGFIFSRDLRLVPAHSFPPPYSQFAPDPPPPYVSRENLVASRNDLNRVNSFVPDQNGNIVVTEDDASAVDDINTSESAEANNRLIVAFDTCDGNGNIGQFSTHISRSHSGGELLDYSRRPAEDDDNANETDSKSEEASDPSTSRRLQEHVQNEDDLNGNTDQSNTSVHTEERLRTNFNSSTPESDERGSVFPPHNLEFIDSDIGDDRNRIEI